MSKIKLLVCFIFLINITSCTSQTEKINGVSFVASRIEVNGTHTKPVVDKVNANYATLMPLGYFRDISNPTVRYNNKNHWHGETIEGVKQYAEELRKRNVKIMIKPQLWIGWGNYTGHVNMTSEALWNQFEISYSSFILEYADLAQKINAEIFCIGTELEKFIEIRPKYWNTLIKEVKKIYKGKLTYAANWDEYKRTPFWSQLDFIGIDAYFPVSDEQTPSLEESIKGWQKHVPTIKQLSDKVKKPILFTEYGYRSVDYSGKEPWNYNRSMNKVNLQAQVNTTKALYETFWDKDWFAGGFIWKWFVNYNKSGGINNSQFTPQNKPVEKIIKEYYSKY